ncbi:hypothetical protein [Flaviaesturariibacter amylovorans]|uniref:DUF4397 domain-containing protein n=1 Tax=Flaviaesturariibacter amylovorans TaxID=1084520 RepID=A0ABP8H084_9BACT
MRHALLFSLLCAGVFACSKRPATGNEPGGPAGGGLSYGDSILYLKSASYTVRPNTGAGQYSAFPDNLLIDPATGTITVTNIGKANESQTGIRYRIRYQPASGPADSTYIVLGGINYLDRIYNFAQHDTLMRPLYNASLGRLLPPGAYGIQPDARLAIDPATGVINLKECMRRGMFDLPVENGEWEEVTVRYKTRDGSNEVTNSIDVAIYYYDSMADIPSNVSVAMRAHQAQILGVAQTPIPPTTGPIDTDLPDNLSLTKPRPPCIIVIPH